MINNSEVLMTEPPSKNCITQYSLLLIMIMLDSSIINYNVIILCRLVLFLVVNVIVWWVVEDKIYNSEVYIY